MPWTGQQFAERHNHSLAPHQAAHAARIANAILDRGEPEGIAIATANRWAQHHAAGGGIAGYDDGGATGTTPTSGVGGIAPSAQTTNPIYQGLIQRYASYPVEKLRELQGILGGTPQGQIVSKLLQQKQTQPNAGGQIAGQPQQAQQQQAPQQMPVSQQTGAVGTPPVMRRGGGIANRDAGGGMAGVPLSMADPWWTRQESYNEDRPQSGGGYLSGATMGRADALKTTAPAGSYVIPADVMAGLGDGNNMAGAKVMDRILSTGPHGVPMPRAGRGMGAPRPPRPMQTEAKGGGVQAGGVGGVTPVALSHGEYVVAPEHVLRVGHGSLKRGHAVLDRLVVELRRRHIAKLKALPGPVRAAA
jgi:hypothetical protein